ncbi:hypothetical protein T459_34130 [Capsicum annuum]|uniref:TF-B3 domain-containing protein n=1 Tax=Capsicum annuum TaxID=4072 RepID=A0A2G2XWX5_CAPAN|nr:hypothetical protein T459_34130 [Capsicum annuum]
MNFVDSEIDLADLVDLRMNFVDLGANFVDLEAAFRDLGMNFFGFGDGFCEVRDEFCGWRTEGRDLEWRPVTSWSGSINSDGQVSQISIELNFELLNTKTKLEKASVEQGNGDTSERIPPAFLKFFNGDVPSICMLENLAARSWKVVVEKKDDNFFFMEGWVDFVLENNLEFGDFLTFSYAGNSKFYVKIYEKNGSLRHLHLSPCLTYKVQVQTTYKEATCAEEGVVAQPADQTSERSRSPVASINSCEIVIKAWHLSNARLTCIARSTMKSEFIALDKAGEEAEWLRNFLEDIPYWPKPVAPVCIHCDSQAAIGRARSMLYNGKSRHIRRRHNTVRELLSGGIITVDYVKSKDNVSDPLTKGLSREGVKTTSKGWV